MKLSIISINYKRAQLTIGCITSLWKYYQNEFEKDEFEYIVIDNDSQDGSLEVLHKEIKKYKNFHVLENNYNAGFSLANNFGEAKARGEYLLFLNNDTIIEDRGLIRMLAYAEQHPKIGAIGGKITSFDGSEQSSSGNFYSMYSVTLFILGLQKFGFIDRNPKSIREVDWVKGALLMTKKKVFENVGKFDEHIFMYTEDMELCFRIHQSGLKCVFFPDVTIKHKDQGSTNRTFAIVHIYKYLPYFYKKHKSFFEYQYVKTLLQCKALVLINIGRLLRNTYFINTYSQALKTIE